MLKKRIKNSSDEKKERIRKVLRENTQGLPPKEVSRLSGVNYHTTKKLLKKMPEVKQKEGIFGYYILDKKMPSSLFDCNIENLRLSFSSDQVNVIQRVCEVNSLNDLIKIRFEIGAKSNKATMSVGTTYPLNFSCLALLGFIFQTLVEKHCKIKPRIDQIFINTFELNKDYFDMTLEGCHFIRLDSLLVEYKLYFKDKKHIREEYKFKQKISLEFLRTLIGKGLFYAETNQKIDKLNYEIKTLKRKLARFNELFLQYLKK